MCSCKTARQNSTFHLRRFTAADSNEQTKSAVERESSALDNSSPFPNSQLGAQSLAQHCATFSCFSNRFPFERIHLKNAKGNLTKVQKVMEVKSQCMQYQMARTSIVLTLTTASCLYVWIVCFHMFIFTQLQSGYFIARLHMHPCLREKFTQLHHQTSCH